MLGEEQLGGMMSAADLFSGAQDVADLLESAEEVTGDFVESAGSMVRQCATSTTSSLSDEEWSARRAPSVDKKGSLAGFADVQRRTIPDSIDDGAVEQRRESTPARTGGRGLLTGNQSPDDGLTQPALGGMEGSSPTFSSQPKDKGGAGVSASRGKRDREQISN